MQVVYGGADVFNAVVYGEQHPSNQQYFQQQIQNFGNTLTDIGRKFFDNSKEIFDRAYNSETMRLARNAAQVVMGIFQPNIIRKIEELQQMQNAPIVMQRWIMANPTIRELYHQQRCDGYSDSYVDVSPNQIKENHYDYRRVMDGVLQESKTSDGQDTWKVQFFMDDIFDGDRDLNHHEKVDILSTWDIAEMFIKNGEDPTSPWGSKL